MTLLNLITNIVGFHNKARSQVEAGLISVAHYDRTVRELGAISARANEARHEANIGDITEERYLQILSELNASIPAALSQPPAATP